ncbi:hypothetical protein ACQEVG_18805 [Streptomyces sp. CA-135486]|uniref:hypothetical protein n=1 Tax=Streptomyces sp. CA-135486 TaxID=3240049 RepID=UPI003D8AA509
MIARIRPCRRDQAGMARDIRVSTVVMAHPDRRHQAEQLRRRHPELDIQIVLDPEPEGKPATLRTAKLAWSAVREDATHQLVLQEDVQLCNGFAAAMHQALQVAPEGAIAFFANWVMSTSQAVRLAAFTGASWTPVVDSWAPTQALIIPAPLARQFAGFAERYSADKPDNRAMAEFLTEHGLTTYVSVPNLVEHRPAQSLLLNDLFYGIRNSTVFPLGQDLGAETFTSTVATPPAVAHLGLGDFESLCHYEPLGRVERSTMNINEVLLPAGMSTLELEEAFVSDLDYHPEALKPGFGPSMLFQFWLTMFVQGIVARGMLEPVGPKAFDKRLDASPWARIALGTFAAGALRKTCPRDKIHDTAAQLTPLCITGMRTGFAAIEHWPDLRSLWAPDANTIRPRWNAGTKESK